MTRRSSLRILILLLVAGSSTASRAAPQQTSTASIAAASNLVFALDALVPAFAASHPQFKLLVSTGASGSIVAQIQHGAPFDVFLSADLDYPRALIASDQAEPETLITFAHGILCLWPVPAGSSYTELTALLTSVSARRIAIANPDTAPFGRAAQNLLIKQGLWTTLKPRLIFGENVAQAYQFVRSGNAQIGFVPLSLLTAKPSDKPHRVLDAATPELAHGAILLRHGSANPAARAFLAWLETQPAQTILIAHGYQSPAESEASLDVSP
jgi:molybdate transport system substrate-binding protein